ncbi:hypothetical protein AB1283_01870 [Bacillus sp. S13(2024)]|uniref:hypothetical protein n=1 Tax=unclassified Bacillus (in: firmicutes) TaxID=185979 RepID=UPI003D1C5AE4
MGKAIMFCSLVVFMFRIARILSFLGGRKWSLFAKSTWKQDFYVCIGIALMVTLLFF